MKIKTQSIIGALILLAFLVGTALIVTGCQTASGERKPLITVTPQSLEKKAEAITLVVAKKVLANNPAEKYRKGFESARDDLKVIAESSEFGLTELTEVIDRLPEGALGNEDDAFYIKAGILFFSDELGAVAVNQPEQVQFVARGMARALDKVLAK